MVNDRVRQTSTSTGTGPLTLDSALATFTSFQGAGLGDGRSVYYAIVNRHASGEWETGVGTVTGNRLVRTQVLGSSNGGAAVNFSVGLKDVFGTIPAERAVYVDTVGNLVSGPEATTLVDAQLTATGVLPENRAPDLTIAAHTAATAVFNAKVGTTTTPRALADGVTDDAAAINGVIAAAIAAGEYVAELPEGQYLIRSTIRVNGRVHLRARRGATLLVDPTAPRFTPVLVQSDDLSSIFGVILEGFTLDGALKGTLDNGLIQFNNAIGTVDGCRLYRGGTPGESSSQGVAGIAISAGGVGVPGLPVVTVRNCEVSYCTKAGVYAAADLGVLIEGNYLHDLAGNSETPGVQIRGGINARVIGNFIRNTEGSGVFVATVGTTPPGYPERCVILGNTIEASGTGTTSGANITVANAEGQLPTTLGKIVIAHNTCRVAGVGGNLQPNILLENQDDLDVDGNLCDGATLMAVQVQNCRRVTYRGGHLLNGNTSNTAGIGAIVVQSTGTSVTEFLTVEGVQMHNVTGQGGHFQYPLLVQALGGAGGIRDFTWRDNTVHGCETSDAPSGITIGRRFSLAQTFHASTPDGSYASAWSATLEDGVSARVRADIISGLDNGAAQSDLERRALVYRGGGGAQIRDTASPVTLRSNPNWDAQYIVGGNDVTLQVRGDTGQTVRHRVALAVESVGAP